jgi:hypothetical protein
MKMCHLGKHGKEKPRDIAWFVKYHLVNIKMCHLRETIQKTRSYCVVCEIPCIKLRKSASFRKQNKEKPRDIMWFLKYHVTNYGNVPPRVKKTKKNQKILRGL